MSRQGGNRGGMGGQRGGQVGNRPPVQNKPVQPPKPVIPKAPRAPSGPLLSPTGQKIASTGRMLDQAEGVRGAHSRGEHVGKTTQQQEARGKDLTTSFLSKHDQNKAVAKLGTPGAVTRKDSQAVFVQGAMGRTASIAKVTQKNPNGSFTTFNAKVTQTTVVSQKNGRVHSAYPSGGVPLPKPAPGPSLKPTTKANVTSIATGASQLRSVPKPVDKGPSLAKDKMKGNQTNFKSVTANVPKKPTGK